MSLSSRLFGKNPRNSMTPTAPTTPATVTAAQELGETLELCEKREAHVMRLVEREVDTAKAQAAAGNRKAALEAVKRKKIHEKELDRLSVQKLSLMQSESTLHALKFNSVVISAQERGAAAIEREVKNLGNAEGIDKRLDRLEDALADADDVLGASTRKMGETAQFDDAELLDELEQMELTEELCDITDAGAAGSSGTSAGAAVTTPLPVPAPRPVPLAVPHTSAAQIAKRAEEEREERELAELCALQSSMKIEQSMPMPMMAACY